VIRWVIALAALAGCGDDPLFPDDYAATYTEVRDCRISADHDLHHIRVLADPDALAPYRDRIGEFPVDSIVLKEEYDFADDCQGPILEWTVMQKTDSPARLGWTWQRVDADRSIKSDNSSLCSNCHSNCTPDENGFDSTCAVP
jgi:Cytochrome P460